MSSSLTSRLVAASAVGVLAAGGWFVGAGGGWIDGPGGGGPSAAQGGRSDAAAPDRDRDGEDLSALRGRIRAQARNGAAPRAAAAPSSAPRTHPWLWPLAPRPAVLRRFRAPPGPYAAGHRGLDLATRVRDPVLAVADGVVTHGGPVAGRGTVTVLHADGLRSTYEPVDPSVGRGDLVTQGQPLGVVGLAAGRAVAHCGARACLHLGARRDGSYLDPWPLLNRGELALLPVG